MSENTEKAISNKESAVESFFKNFSGSSTSDKEFEEFGERVNTYIISQKWVRWPIDLSPAVCARFGWKCISYNLLECTTCGAKICTPEPKIEISDVYKACIEKTLKDLKAGHKTHCPWPLTPSPESFVTMIPMPKEETLKFFLQRLKPNLEFKMYLPQIKSASLSHLGLNEQQAVALCKLAEVNSDDSKKCGLSAVTMAATGWTLTPKDEKTKKVYVTCKSCQRSIWSGLFNAFTTSEDTKTTASSSQNGHADNGTCDDSPRAKRFKKDDFDPLDEHRPWCLWINSGSQKQNFNNNDSSEKIEDEEASSPQNFGWMIFLKSLLRNVSELEDVRSELTPSREHIRSVRNLLETWMDPAE